MKKPVSQERRTYLTKYQRETLRKKKKRLELLLEPEDHEYLSAEARRHHMKIGPFVTAAAIAYRTGAFVLPDEAKVIKLEQLLRNIGNNLNQVARGVNRDGDLVDPEQLYTYHLAVEESVSDALRNPLALTDLIADELSKNPAFRAELTALLEEGRGDDH